MGLKQPNMGLGLMLTHVLCFLPMNINSRKRICRKAENQNLKLLNIHILLNIILPILCLSWEYWLLL